MLEQWKIEYLKTNKIEHTYTTVSIKTEAYRIELWCYDKEKTVNISYAGLKPES